MTRVGRILTALFRAEAEADQITEPPAFTRPWSNWELCLRKENNSSHILVREHLEDGSFPVIPEDPSLPAAVLYGPNSVIKLRKQTPIVAQILPAFGDCIDERYQGRMRVTEQLHTSE
jgi:hypothetical protein